VAAATQSVPGRTAYIFHGTREAELASIRQRGLRALMLSERRAALVAVFSEHPDWLDKEPMLDGEIHRFAADHFPDLIFDYVGIGL
jgi:hypothetical protein